MTGLVKEDKSNADYLGDGVYAIYDGFGIWLHINDHNLPADSAYLEPSVMEALIRFAKRMEVTNE